jgi:hypothetical protein
MPTYVCDRCGWNTNNKAHFKQHLQRKYICNPLSNISRLSILKKYFPEVFTYEKDEILNFKKENIELEVEKQSKIINEANIENDNSSYICSNCNKVFHYKQSKWRHQKNCHSILNDLNSNDNSDKTKIKQLITKLNEEKSKVKDKEKLLSKYAEIIDKITEKSTNITNTTNNTTNNTTINFQVNAFGSENISYISKSFLNQLLKIPYTSVPKLLEFIHFNKNFPENQNVKIFSRKEKWAQKHNGTEWEFIPKNTLIGDMISNGVNILEVHYEENGGKEELNDIKRDRWEKFTIEFHDEKPTVIKRLYDDTECLLLNKLSKKEINDETTAQIPNNEDDEIELEIQKDLETLNTLDFS